MERVCTKCGAKFPQEEKVGKSGRCKKCRAARQREYRAKDREKTNAEHRAYAKLYRKKYPEKQKAQDYRAHLMKNYSITPEEVDALIAQQEEKCLLCGIPLGLAKRTLYHIDHCHETGKVRGILCNKCNRGLGFFNDSPAKLRRAILYLSKSEYDLDAEYF